MFLDQSPSPVGTSSLKMLCEEIGLIRLDRQAPPKLSKPGTRNPRTFGAVYFSILRLSMAPLSRGRSRQRGVSIHRSKGSFRGSERGRGRGRGRGSFTSRAANRSTFYSTRVEEQQSGNSGSDHDGSEPGYSSAGAVSSSSEESEQDVEPTKSLNPYNALLQSLSANVPRAEPQRKRRKIQHIEAHQEPTVAKYALDIAGESEEGNDLVDDDAEEADNEEVSGHDHFSKHISDRDEAELAHQVQDVKDNRWRTAKQIQEPGWSTIRKNPVSLETTYKDQNHSLLDFDGLCLKEKLKGPGRKFLLSLDPVAGTLASSILTYTDTLFPQRLLQNAESLRKIACLHSLNHIFKTRDKVIRDNARLAKEDDKDVIELRDQGFTRPKVLILLPTRQSCIKYVDTIIALCEPEQQENRKRFQDSYASGEDHFSEDKPEDFRELFAGNDDDMFRLGMKFTRKTIKYFAQFYNSDIIFASPLGLRMALGADDPKKQDHDFLSSIEILVVDQADAMSMQNWEHVEYLFEHLNLQPKEAHGCDFSRVRNWYLDGNAKYLRQTILFSAFNFPSLNKLYTHHMLNVAGKVKYSKSEEGAMVDLAISPKQTFSRFDFKAPSTEPDDRFRYFSTAISPSLTKYSKHSAGFGQGVLIYLPTYADFVRVRNFLATSSITQDISFGSISEYTSVKDVARARSHFLSGRHSVLLYTERAHHFRRYHLKGVRRVIMYGLPENPIFYKEVVGGYLGSSMACAQLDAREASVRVLFSKLDLFKLERISGSSRFVSMLQDKGGDTFDFV